MIEGLTPRLISNTQHPGLVEIELTVSDPGDPALSEQAFALTVLLVIGPPDPNALAYLVPRAVFERELPVHVGTLDGQDDQTEQMLEILEVMAPSDIVVFLCETDQTVKAACETLGLS